MKNYIMTDNQNDNAQFSADSSENIVQISGSISSAEQLNNCSDMNKTYLFNVVSPLADNLSVSAGCYCIVNNYNNCLQILRTVRHENGVFIRERNADNNSWGEFSEITIPNHSVSMSNLSDYVLSKINLFEVVTAHGIVGDGKKDNSEDIQRLIDNCYQQGISTIYFPEGNYIVKKPIYLYDNMEIRGQSQYSTHIIKESNVKDCYGTDSIIVFRSYENCNQSTKGQKVKFIDIVGNIETFEDEKEDKNTDINSKVVQIAIYAEQNSPYVIIDEVETHKVDNAIDLKGAWVGRFERLKIRGNYVGLRIRKECQGIVLSGINVIGTHKYGFYLAGSGYNSINSIFVEWAYGGTAFYFSYGTFSVNGIGYEISKNLECGIHAERSNVLLTNAFLPQQNLDSFSAIYSNNKSVVDIMSSTYGFQSQNANYQNLRSGRLYKANANSKIFVRSSVRKGLLNSGEFPIENECSDNSEILFETIYDQNNIESKSGHFTIPQELADYFSNADYYFQRIGRMITVGVKILASADIPEDTVVKLDNLPFKSYGVSTRQVLLSSKNNIKNSVIPMNSSSFVFYGGLKQGEAITAVVTYIMGIVQ